jgi:hypothetical protein
MTSEERLEVRIVVYLLRNDVVWYQLVDDEIFVLMTMFMMIMMNW